jgi:hypothetical protein
MPKDNKIDKRAVDVAAEVNGESLHTTGAPQSPRRFIASPEQRRITELFGKLDWDDAFNHKSERWR